MAAMRQRHGRSFSRDKDGPPPVFDDRPEATAPPAGKSALLGRLRGFRFLPGAGLCWGARRAVGEQAIRSAMLVAAGEGGSSGITLWDRQ